MRRFQPVLDYLRANPRFVLSIGSMIASGPARDRRLAQHFFEEVADRGMSPGVPGVLLLGAHHASAVPAEEWPTTRMLLEKRGHRCVSILVLTDFVGQGDGDDTVMPLVRDEPVTRIEQVTGIRLTSLAATAPVAIPTDRPSGTNEPRPFRRVTFGNNGKSMAEQYEYVVLHKA